VGLGSLGQLMPASSVSASSTDTGRGSSAGTETGAGGAVAPGDTLTFAEAFERDIRGALDEVESGGPESETGPRGEAQMWRHLLGARLVPGAETLRAQPAPHPGRPHRPPGRSQREGVLVPVPAERGSSGERVVHPTLHILIPQERVPAGYYHREGSQGKD